MSKIITHDDFIKRIHDLNPDIEIIGKYVKAKNKIECHCLKCDNVWFPTCDNLSRKHFCKKCESKKWGDIYKTSQEEIKLKIKELVGDQITLKSDHINNCISHVFHCNICGQEFQRMLTSFYNYPVCPICDHIECVKGINDLWTTHPELAEMLLDPEDGYTITYRGDNPVDWKCKCGNVIRNKSVQRVMKHGLCCPQCGDHFSYPNKFMYNLLTQLHIEFMPEKIFEWSQNKKYDFYIPSICCIIEMHGLQHYTDIKTFGSKVCDVHTNDVFKRQLASDYGISSYIEIDAKYSNCEHIKNSILHSQIIDMLDISKIDWHECDEMAQKSIIFDICSMWNNDMKIIEISSLLKIHTCTISRYLKFGKELGLCNYNPIESRKSNCKTVVCITTGEIFATMKEADIKYYAPKISGCCNGRTNYSGRLSTGERLTWRYFTEGEIVEPCEITSEVVYRNKSSKPVMCLTTNEVFEAIAIAARQYKIHSNTILNCCKGRTSFGGRSSTGEKLIWQYI